MIKQTNYQRLYEIAENQSGYFRSNQALSAGYSRPNLYFQTERGRFIRISKGIYRLSFFPSSPFDDFFVAILESGPRSVVSHASALAVYELSDILPGEIHITISRNRSRRRAGIKYHTCKISKNEITSYKGLPITTVERTITDAIRNGLDPHLVKQAIHQGIDRGMLTRASLLDQARHSDKRTLTMIHSILSEDHA